MFTFVCFAIIAILVIAFPARASSTPTFIAGYEAETDVDNYLVRDLIQEEFEMLMESETCHDLTFARDNFWLKPDPKGGYFRSLPTWGQFGGENTSNEWNELIQYYNDDDFQVLWVKKALNRKKTTYSPRGNADWKVAFGPEGDEGENLEVDVDEPCVGYEESVKKATAYTYAYIESVQLMQKAIDLVDDDSCIYNENNCEDALEAWDASVAIFAGSLEGSDGDNCDSGCYGKSLYALGDILCPIFRKCGPDGNLFDKDKVSDVNNYMMQKYASGRTATKSGDLILMRRYQRYIGAKMIIPFVQGVLLHAWRLSDEGGVGTFSNLDKEVAMAGTYAMTAVPKLWAVSKKAAMKVEDQLKIGGGVAGLSPINYLDVKLSFECNYKYMGLSCVEVGSVYDGAKDPLPGATWCQDSENGSSEDFYCRKPDKERKKLCNSYTGKPGIDGRNKISYFFI